MRHLKLLFLAAILFCCQLAWSQSRTITGKVTDANGAPISGVSVVVKGSRTGTITQADGTYTISLPANSSTLIFSSLGYETTELQAKSSTLNTTLATEGSKSLDEVVVVGFGTKIKKDVTGNIARVKGAEIANTPVPQFTQALQGRAAGVFVEANNGKVGEGVKVRIRGAGSLSASNSPLYVVDGIPIAEGGVGINPLADINFNDVETFDILKDASAAAIYGSRAANGVVLITTKKGKSGKTAVNVNAQYGSNKPTNHREFLNAAQYVELLREAAINSDGIDGVDPLDPAQYSNSWLEYVEDKMTEISGYSDWRTLQTNTNWEREAYNNDARTKIIDISAQGGSEKTKFYASGSYSDQDGILIGNKFQRMSGRLNLEHDASDRLRIGMNMGLSRTYANRVAADNGFQTPLQLVALAPITPVRDLNGKLYDDPITTYYNGLVELESVKRSSIAFRNLGNIFLNYKVFKGLNFRTEFGLDIQNQTDDYYAGLASLTGSGINGYGSSSWYKSVNYNTNNYFNYHTVVKNIHDIDATLGMSFQKYSSENVSVTGQDFPTDDLPNLASAGQITGGSSSITESSFLSYFLRSNYKYNNKYLVSLSGRIDGSSRFGRLNRYGFFPSASVGWILSEESFLANSNVVSFLKLRGSWGITGNAEGFGNFAQLGLWGAAKYNASSGLVPTQLANPELKWEKSEQVDIGVDFGLFNNKLSGEIDYYVRNTRDLIYNVPVPGTSGFSTQTVNVGAMQNKGVELVLNSTNISGRDFKWSTSFNIAYNKNKITKLDGDQTLIPGNDGRYLNSLIVGEAIGVFYGPKYAGVDPQNGDALWFEEDGKTTTNEYNQAGNFIVGNPNPDWIGGLTNTVSYKGIELSFLFQGVFGNQIQNGAGGFMSTGADWWDNQTIDQLRRWRKPGDITDVPQARFYYSNGTGASSRYTENGSYVRLKTVTLGYYLPASVIKKLKLSSARLYLSGVNLLTFTDYTGWDPEVNTDYRATNRNQGGDFYAAPQIKSITFGINIGF
ncbi:MAG: SusC/RagA family TonB-linked outer membrane protein [Citrobacter freundii]|nr:MAG: SusC/RagA family TonB-linked outer membrane protein [Citrobacter freundii]